LIVVVLVGIYLAGGMWLVRGIAWRLDR
jgi:hypothetical protein